MAANKDSKTASTPAPAASTPAAANANTPAAPTKKRRVVLYIIGALVALALIGGAWAYFGTDKAVKVSDEFITDLTAGRFDEAYDVVSKEFREAYTEEDFKEALANIPDAGLKLGKLTERKIEKTSTGERATLTYDATAKDGEYEVEVILVKEDGNWLVYNFQSTQK